MRLGKIRVLVALIVRNSSKGPTNIGWHKTTANDFARKLNPMQERAINQI
jgi:hypothetical protein